MTWVLALIGFSTPSWIARSYFRKDRSILPLFQDLFVGAQLSALSLIFPWLTPLFQLLILYDGLIDKKLHFRLDGSCLSLLFQIRSFKDSAKAIDVFRVFPLFLPLSLLSFALPPLSLWFLFLGVPFFFFKTELVRDSLIILWEKQALAFLSKPFKKKKKDFSTFAKKEILSSQEIYTAQNPHYPLFRYTHGFRGEKELNIAITPEKKPHIMFLFVESLRAKDMGCLGGEYGVTSRLDSLAKESYLYSNFYANSLLTFRSIYTSLFGLPYSLEMKTALDRDIPTYGLPHHLKKLGYETNFFKGAHWGLGGVGPFLKQIEGDRVFDKKELERFDPSCTGGSIGIHDEFLFKMTLDHFERDQKTPQFYSLLTVSSHHPWTVPPHYEPPSLEEVDAGYYRNYLKTLHYTDHAIGNFIKQLKEKNLTKDLILFIMGDHGCYFGDDNTSFEYRRDNHKENYHVPLMIYADGRIKDPKTIDTLASQCDLLPTLMDLLNIKGHQHSIGKSLLRKGQKPKVYVHDSANFKGDFCFLQGEKFIKYEHLKHEKIYPHLANFREMLFSIYEDKLTVPATFEGGDYSLRTEPYKPPRGLSKEKLSQMIASQSPMTALNLEGNQSVDEELLAQVADSNPDLDFISLKDSYSLTDQGLSSLLEKCVNIYDLDISDCHLLTEKCLDSLPQTLMKLRLKGLDFVSDAHFVKKIKHLEMLDIRETPLTDKGLSRFPEVFPNLSFLDFSYRNMTLETIRKTIDSLPLYKLQIFDSENLTNKEAFTLLQPHPTLRFITLSGCQNLTDELFFQLKELDIRHLSLIDIPHLSNRGLEALLSLPIDSLHVEAAPNLTSEAFPIIDKYAHQFADLSIKVLIPVNATYFCL